MGAFTRPVNSDAKRAQFIRAATGLLAGWTNVGPNRTAKKTTPTTIRLKAKGILGCEC